MFHDRPVYHNEYGELTMYPEAQLRLECVRAAAQAMSSESNPSSQSSLSAATRLKMIADELYDYVIHGSGEVTRRR